MTPYLYIVVAAVIFGSSGVFIKSAGLPATSMALIRMAVPFVLMTAVFLVRRKRFPSFRDRFMLLASVLNAVRLFFYFAGYARGQISTTVILLYTWPVFAAAWSFLFLGERLSRRHLFLFTVAFAGVGLITLDKTFSLSDQRFSGVLFILLSAFVYSMTIVIFKKKSGSYDPFETLWFQNMVGVFAFLPFFITTRPWPMVWQGGLATVYGGLVGVLGFGLFFAGLRRVEASRASFLTYIEVVSGIFFGVVFFKERLSMQVVAGGSLVLLAALALGRADRRGETDGPPGKADRPGNS